jgi:DNA helicase-2/ATP-dependent DNA helicase PcrA
VENHGFKYQDIAILYRNNALSRTVENELTNFKIPYRIFGGVHFYQRKEIKDLLAYLRVIANPNDELAIKRIVNVPRRGIGPGRINKIGDFALSNHLSFMSAFYQSNDQDVLEFVKLIDKFREETIKMPISEKLNHIIEAIKYHEYLQNFDDDYETRYENINELFESIKVYESNTNDSCDINLYLQEIALYTEPPKRPSVNDNLVSLMTMHVAKGSEYPVVFIIGLNYGVLPSLSSPNKEEERRLFYVGITRAKKRLFLSCSTTYSYQLKTDNKSSPFIEEINLADIEKVTDQMVTQSNYDLE